MIGCFHVLKADRRQSHAPCYEKLRLPVGKFEDYKTNFLTESIQK